MLYVTRPDSRKGDNAKVTKAQREAVEQAEDIAPLDFTKRRGNCAQHGRSLAACDHA